MEKKKKNESEEKKLQKAVCKWLKLQYPKILFNSDMSGFRLTKGQANEAKEMRSTGEHFPDLIIYKKNNMFSGLFIEFKSKTPYLKNGQLSKSEHIQDQYRTMQKLKSEGFKCYFIWDFDQAIHLISDYLNEIVF